MSKIELKRNKPDEQEVAFSFIKPLSVHQRDGIFETIRDEGLDILHSDDVVLNPSQVDRIYPDTLQSHFYRDMRAFICGNVVVAMIIGGECEDVQSKMMELKKTEDGRDGRIREKFGNKVIIPKEEIELWRRGAHPRQVDVTIALTQNNVIHVTDSVTESIEMINLVFGDSILHTGI